LHFNPVYQRVLERAVDTCGGASGVARLLGVPRPEVQAWLDGAQPLPPAAFFELVDLLVDGSMNGTLAGTPLGNRAPPAVRETAEQALREALELYGTDLGNVQLLNSRGSLEIVAERGFAAPFLEFFREVSAGHSSACGRALRLARSILVPDVAASEIFRATEAREVMLAAGARAVQSTPVLSTAGHAYGMISTHFRVPLGGAPLPPLADIARKLGDRLQALQDSPLLAA
jgi:DNA-binding transcriptional regulator YdaS (Cro superfamily)